MNKPLGFSLVVEQKRVTQNEEEPPEASPQAMVGFFQIIVILFLALVFIGLGIYIGYVIWGNKSNPSDEQNINALISPGQNEPQFQAEKSDGWTLYTDINFSFKYPVTWMMKRGFATKDDLIVYDPKSIKVTTQNGSQNRVPSVYVDIISVAASTKSASEVVANYVDSMKQKNINIKSEESPVLKSNMILFDNPGGNGKNVILSKSGMLATITTSAQNLTENSTENTILQSFNFLQQVKQ